MSEDLPEHVSVNRCYWDGMADQWVAAGERHWAADPAWGTWSIPNEDAELLPDKMSGLRAIELGCGTGYVSAWMVRRGAHVVAIDNSQRQLDTCSRLQDEHDLHFETIHGNAETVPYPDAHFDFAISEYGAAVWADPYQWIPEAARLLCAGGQLVFLSNSPIQLLCVPQDGSDTTRQLARPYFGMHRLDWRNVEVDLGGIEFNLPISEWVSLFNQTGFAIEDYLELTAPTSAEGTRFGVPAEWARHFPGEQVWKLRKR